MIAPDTDAPQPRHGLRFDGTITAGNLLTAICMSGLILVWGLRLEGRVDKIEALSTQAAIYFDKIQAAQVSRDADLDAKLDRLDDKITLILRGTK